MTLFQNVQLFFGLFLLFWGAGVLLAGALGVVFGLFQYGDWRAALLQGFDWLLNTATVGVWDIFVGANSPTRRIRPDVSELLPGAWQLHPARTFPFYVGRIAPFLFFFGGLAVLAVTNPVAREIVLNVLTWAGVTL